MLSSEVFSLSSISGIRKPVADRGLEAPSPENAEAIERDTKGEHLAILNENIE